MLNNRSRSGAARRREPGIRLDVPSDSTIFITGCLRSAEDGEEPRKEIAIRMADGPGFIPGFVFERALRYMRRQKSRKGDTHVTRLSDDEFRFEPSEGKKVTLTVKRVRSGYAMYAKIDLRDSDEGVVIRKTFTSATVDEIETLIDATAGMLVHYRYEPTAPNDVEDDERTWLSAFCDDFDAEYDSAPVSS